MRNIDKVKIGYCKKCHLKSDKATWNIINKVIQFFQSKGCQVEEYIYEEHIKAAGYHDICVINCDNGFQTYFGPYSDIENGQTTFQDIWNALTLGNEKAAEIKKQRVQEEKLKREEVKRQIQEKSKNEFENGKSQIYYDTFCKECNRFMGKLVFESWGIYCNACYKFH